MELTQILNGLLSLPDKVSITEMDTGYLYIIYKGVNYLIEYKYNYLSVEQSDGIFVTFTETSKMITETIENYKYATSN